MDQQLFILTQKKKRDYTLSMSNLAKNALSHTLFELLEVMSFDKITVSQLINQCGISRSTFYYHFKDIYDLLEYSLIDHFSKVLGNKKTTATWTDGFLAILEEIYAERKALSHIVGFIDRSVLENALQEPVYKLLYNVVLEQAADMNVAEEKKVFIAGFYRYGFVGLVISWMEHGFQQSPQVLADNLSHLMHGTFSHALKEYQTNEA